jgi:hypothetical protein
MSETRLDTFELEYHDTLDADLEPPVRAFLRRVGLGHVYDELLRPTMAEGATVVAMAVKRRPWPPWGVGAMTLSAMAIATSVDRRTAGVCAVLAVPEEATAIPLHAATYVTLLEGLADRGVERVHHVVREGSELGHRIGAIAGLEPSPHLILTEHARYWLHDAEIARHRDAIGLSEHGVDELLAGEGLAHGAFDRVALFLLGVSAALAPWWREEVAAGEIIANTGPGRVAECLPPGGPPKHGEREIRT